MVVIEIQSCVEAIVETKTDLWKMDLIHVSVWTSYKSMIIIYVLLNTCTMIVFTPHYNHNFVGVPAIPNKQL